MKDQISQVIINLLEINLYKDIYVSTICEKVPISRQTFYRYFHSKDAVIEWFIEQDFMKNAFPLFRYHLKEKGVSAFFSYIKENPLFYQRILEHDNGILLEHCLKKAYNTAADYTSTFSLPVKKRCYTINPKVYRLYAINGIVAILIYWIQDNMKISEEDIAKDLYLMMEEPLGIVRDYYLTIKE
ncbi:MAG: TetR/AcrR family transcriptional regulator [Eubacteriaceae bacterium]